MKAKAQNQINYKSEMIRKWEFASFSKKDWEIYSESKGDPMIAFVKKPYETLDWEVIINNESVHIIRSCFTKPGFLSDLHYVYEKNGKEVDLWEIVWIVSQMPELFVESQLLAIGFENISF